MISAAEGQVVFRIGAKDVESVRVLEHFFIAVSGDVGQQHFVADPKLLTMHLDVLRDRTPELHNRGRMTKGLFDRIRKAPL